MTLRALDIVVATLPRLTHASINDRHPGAGKVVRSAHGVAINSSLDAARRADRHWATTHTIIGTPSVIGTLEKPGLSYN